MSNGNVGQWDPKIDYVEGDEVDFMARRYRCVKDHEPSIRNPEEDLMRNKEPVWELLPETMPAEQAAEEELDRSDRLDSLVAEAAGNLRKTWKQLRLPWMSAADMAKLGPGYAEHQSSVELAAQLLESMTVQGSTQDRITVLAEGLDKTRFHIEGYYQSDVDGAGRPLHDEFAGSEAEDGHEWSSDREYKEGDVVEFGGFEYMCVKAHGPNRLPPNVSKGEELWQDMAEMVSEWSALASYKKGDRVSCKGEEYECLLEHGPSGDSPEVHLAQLDSGDKPRWALSLADQLKRSEDTVPPELDPAVKNDGPAESASESTDESDENTEEDGTKQWQQGHLYDIGEARVYDNRLFQCVKKMTDVAQAQMAPPFAEKFWKEVPNEAGNTGAGAGEPGDDKIYSPEKQYKVGDKVLSDDCDNRNVLGATAWYECIKPMTPDDPGRHPAGEHGAKFWKRLRSGPGRD